MPKNPSRKPPGRQPTSAAINAAIPPGRLWTARILLAVLVPLAVLLGVEISLRLAGIGYPTNYFLPANIAGHKFFVSNERFGYRFFPRSLARTPLPVRIAAVKPANECRIFLFGESAALGDPDPSFGAGRYLEVLLRDHFPGIDFHIVCVAMTAINSHTILPIARECTHHNGDLWIIYMGNNEMVGPFGGGTVFGRRAPRLALIRAGLAIKTTKIGQAIDLLTSKMSDASAMPKSWSGLNMFNEQRLGYNAPSRLRTYDNFNRNLEDILRAAQNFRIPVLLSTVGSNLKDCAPFASLNSPNLTDAQKSEWETLYRAGTNSESLGDFPAALDSYQRAMRIDSQFAELQFRTGNCHLATGNSAEALHDFTMARDCDALDFRADSRINQDITDAAMRRAGQGVVFLDAANILAQASPGGIPGQELFYDHVHLNFTGNYLLGHAFAEKVAKLLPAAITARGKGNWANEDYCDLRLAVSPWDQLRVWQMNYSRVSEPPFTGQLNDVTRAKAYIAKLNELKEFLTAPAADASRAVYVNAVKATPDDYLLHQNFSQFMEERGDLASSIEEQQIVCRLLPCYPGPQNKTGQLLIRQGHTAEATKYFSAALALDNCFVPALNEMGLVAANEGKPAVAAAHFSRAQQLNPGYLETYFNWGFLDQSEGHLDQAITRYQMAAQIQPNGPAIFFSQAVTAAAQHRRADAINYFHTTLWMFPAFWQAHYLLGVELTTQESVNEAQAQFLEVTRMRPDFARAHLNLGVAYAKQGKLDEALQQFNLTLQLNPTNKSAQRFIETTQVLQERQKHPR